MFLRIIQTRDPSKEVTSSLHLYEVTNSNNQSIRRLNYTIIHGKTVVEQVEMEAAVERRCIVRVDKAGTNALINSRAAMLVVLRGLRHSC